jgi:hypothetical protein
MERFGGCRQRFTEFDLRTTWVQLGRLSIKERRQLHSRFLDQLEQLQGHSLDRVGERKEVRSIANVSHALATMGLYGGTLEPLWQAMCKRVVPLLKGDGVGAAGAKRPLEDTSQSVGAARQRAFEPQNLSNTVWAFATAGHAAPDLFDAIGAASMLCMREFKPQISSTRYGRSPLPVTWRRTSSTRSPHATRALALLDEFNPQELSNTVWMFVKAGHEAPALFDVIATRALPLSEQFNPQELSKTMWAFAKAGHEAPALFDAIATRALPLLEQFNPQDLSKTVWAFATAGRAAPALFDTIATWAPALLEQFNPQDLSNTVWAFATADHEAPALFSAIATQALPILGKFNPQKLSNTVWAFARCDFRAPGLFAALGAAAQPLLDRFNPIGLSMIVCEFAKVGAPALALFAGAAKDRVGQFHPFQLVLLAQACAATRHPTDPTAHHPDTRELLTAIAERVLSATHEFDLPQLQQLLIAFKPQHLVMLACACT